MRMSRLWGVALSVLCLLFIQAADDKKKDEKWDVANPSKETYQITVDTDEGTWMNLDVSPDGKEIVFDMLGDIFVVPMAGGEAKALKTGLPWEMQPRFSPDGKWIAFTSDRDGGDNIWVMDRKGENAKAITTESFRLLNNPWWSPDSRYIIARKHFTSMRSLGAGEIWMYHRNGGAGVQLNKKPNEQKDLGEPAFSPDGRYVYYSRDTTPGGTFQYSKDPNPGIYSIRRLDLEEGKDETVISGAGGAIRPTPSPDGKKLAYVRRHHYKTALFVHDLESGSNTMLYDGLDRDMQETWAIHGVYANFAWTPDNKNLVFWSGGKINRIDVESKEITNIPFQVKVDHTMVKVLRRPVDVAPEKFDAKMLRWVKPSPKGDKVVFGALGRLYVRDLPKGKAKLLTDASDHFEYYPAWSRDGEHIIYVSWNDQDQGQVRMVSAAGGSGKVLTKQPGKYLEPEFSPDGKHFVYRRIGETGLAAVTWSKNPGLYIQSMDGEPVRFSESGVSPHFGAGNDRIYFVTYGEKASSTLSSADTQGNDVREHVTTEFGDEYRVSPDGRWLAFTEHFNAHVVPFRHTGTKVSLSPGTKAIPIATVSKDAGTYLNWNGDADKLTWSLGQTLYERNLKDAFSFLEGAPEELPKAPEAGIDLGFEVEYAKPEGMIALIGARIITMDGDRVIEDGAVLIKGNRIHAIGAKGKVKIPRKAQQVDVSGKTIIPGLVDVHAHGPYGFDEIVPQQNWTHYAGLTFGVTTIHDPSSDTSTVFSAAEMAKAGKILAPRIFSTGAIMYGAHYPTLTSKINSKDDAAGHLRRLNSAGAFSVKSYNQPRRNQRQQVISAARDLNMMVVPEGGSLFQHNMSMIADGHTGIEHNIPVAAIYNDVVQFWSQSQTQYTPTMVVSYGGISGEHYWYQKQDVWKHERLSTFVPDFMLEGRARRRTKAPDHEYNHFNTAKVCKKLTDAGVKVNLGGHGQREGMAAHWELWMFAQGGMTPMEALRSATLNGAEYLGLDGDVGSLVKGKLADLVVLDANPLDDIMNSDKISHVMLNGDLYDAATMNRVGKNPKERKPFYFEGAGANMPNTVTRTEAHSKCGGHCAQ